MRVRFPDGSPGRWASLGGVSECSVRVWLRDPGGQPSEAVLQVDGEQLARATLVPMADHDWIAAADLVLDEPRPSARFTVEVLGERRSGRFAPHPGNPEAFSFGFGSCHQPFGAPEDGMLTVGPGAGIYRPMASVLADAGARFLALIGDQIYSDPVDPVDIRAHARAAKTPPTSAELRDRYRWLYRGYFGLPEFRALLEAQPTLMTWDDHDITEGWGSLLDWDELDERVFRAAEATYREYQHVRHLGASVDDRAPYYRCFWFGDTGFFILDLRGVRSYRDGRLLGQVQWHALYDFLEQATTRGVTTLFVVAGIPVIHHAPAMVRWAERVPHVYGTDLRDRWSAVPIEHERVRLLDLLLDWQSDRPNRQVAILSGDVHAGAAFRVERPGAAGRVVQWTASPLSTHASTPEYLANVIGTTWVNWGDDRYHSTRDALVPTNNFGLVHVTPRAEGGHDLQLTLYGYDPKHGLRPAARVEAHPS